jgi:transcriptional regulator with XRE-family HTH domain
MTPGERIRLARVEILKADQGYLAEKLKVSPMTISKWENNENNPSEAHLQAIADLIGQPVEWFRKGKRSPPTGTG